MRIRQPAVGRIKLDHIASCQPAGPLATPSLSLLLAALRDSESESRGGADSGGDSDSESPPGPGQAAAATQTPILRPSWAGLATSH